jgi:hypothetical protein
MSLLSFFHSSRTCGEKKEKAFSFFGKELDTCGALDFFSPLTWVYEMKSIKILKKNQ